MTRRNPHRDAMERSIADGTPVAGNPSDAMDGRMTRGQRAAAAVAPVAGSRHFIAGVLAVWMAVDATALLIRPFEPCPYTLPDRVPRTFRHAEPGGHRRPFRSGRIGRHFAVMSDPRWR